MQMLRMSLRRRIRVLIVVALFAASSSYGSAGTWVTVTPDGKTFADAKSLATGPQVVVQSQSPLGLEVTVDIAGLELALQDTIGGKFVKAGWPQAAVAGEKGEPGLPVVRRLFLVPQGATVDVRVKPGQASVINLEAVGFADPIMPVQPPVPMIPGELERTPFYHTEASYVADELLPAERAAVGEVGIVRGWRLFMLEVRPVAYNPASGALGVWSRIGVSINFEGGHSGGGFGRTVALKGVLLNPPGDTKQLGTGSGNYLIVVADALAASVPVTEFAGAKTAQGFDVMIHPVAPGTTKEGIKSYIAGLWGTADAPDYLLLMGDIDTIPHWVGGGDRISTTDLPYGCMDGSGDWYPDMAIGRISFNSESQLQAIVDKTLFMEAGDFADTGYARRAAFLAGLDLWSGDESTHNWVIDTYLDDEGFTCDKIYMRTYGAETQDVYDSFNAGVVLASFYGHAGAGPTGNRIWENGPQFYFEDLYALDDGAMIALLLHMTCNVGHYELWDECFTEAWLRAPNKGAAVNIGASEFIYSAGHGGSSGWPETSNLQKFVFDSLYLDGIREVGPMWQAALMRLLAMYGPDYVVTRDYFEMFNLMGDPSLRVPEPKENYLIVTPSGYAMSEPLADFVAAKTGQGYNVSVYTVPSGTSNTDIRTYIESLWNTPEAPKYLLLVGDTDGFNSTTTTIPHWIGEGSRSATTDLPYACMDGGDDWYPDIFVGRFSVRTVDQLRNVVDKSLFVEAGVFSDPDYVKRAAFLATDDSSAGAEETHDWVIENYLEPAGFESTKIYANQGGNTQDIADAVNAGSLFTFYFGHSSSSGWWTPAFDQGDIQALSNAGLYGLAGGWSCNTSHFDNDECFGETWIRQRKKGAAAYLSASNYVWWGSYESWDSSRRMEKYFFESFFVDDIWQVGPAWQAALYRLLADPDYGPGHDHTRNIFEEFVLLGDPALRLPQGVAGFTVAATPTRQDLCLPADDDARYIIQVGETGDCDEPVTLAAEGTPAGATVEFAVNSRLPPFTTVMTVGNLSGATPGSYAMHVRGTSPGMERVTDVTLSIADSAPNTVALTSPANGEIDVTRTPNLIWQPSSQAAAYNVHVATDSFFANIVYSATVNDTSHTLETPLDTATLYYWRVWAVNGCGESAFSSTFSFTTLIQPDYFTEQFSSGFDLDYFTVEFIPDGSGDHYYMCGSATTGLPTDPAGGITLSLSEDAYAAISPLGSQLQLYGVSYGTCYVGDNGYITFTSGDNDYTETLPEHFSMPRVSPLYNDLSAPQGGTVSWKQEVNRIAVTWEDVPVYGTANANTFQVELFFNGEIHITWLGIDCNSAIVGLSDGDGLPEDPFPETDISAAESCEQESSFILDVSPDRQDICAPTDAVYTVDVEPVLGFDESVTLSASGLPAGTTVDFSVNSIPPSFTAAMTIGNTGSATPGEYVVEVTGTATGGMEQADTVDLNLSTAIPGSPLLASPADGQIDVSPAPTLAWQMATQAAEYDLEIAADPAFADIVYSATVADTSHAVEVLLDGLTPYYWHVRAKNACGTGVYSPYFTFTTADILVSVAYDMLNGETGTYTYFDDTYNGSGDNTAPLSPLTGGVGDLTDNVIATGHWNETPGPYVGWSTIDPTITFHFPGPARVSSMTLHLDDSGGGGGVYAPDEVTVIMGGATHVFPVTDPPGDEPFAFTCADLDLMGETLEVTLADYSASDYIMLSEVEFRGAPVGACCVGESCTATAQADCLLQEGEYQGNGTDCEPDPCMIYESGCLIISEVVMGVESGGCPRWLEITNTGRGDFSFVEGGIIVQQDTSADVDVDIDLSGVTILAGQSYVINSNQLGACTGAFPVTYGFDADFYTEVPLGDGDDRYIITNTADGSNLLDIYGEFGVDGTGEEWEYTDGYAYRLPAYNSGSGLDFAPGEWFLSGAGALGGGGNPLQLLLDSTTPGAHEDQLDCCANGQHADFDGDGDVDGVDFEDFGLCFTGADGGPIGVDCVRGDFDCDDDIDCDDWQRFLYVWTGPGVPPVLEECPCWMGVSPDSDPVTRSRILSFIPGNPVRTTALRVRFADLPAPFESFEGQTMWVGVPADVSEASGASSDEPPPTFKSALVTCDPVYMDWGAIGTVQVRGKAIVPGAAYEVQAIAAGCEPELEESYSLPSIVNTSRWADICRDCSVTPCLPPDGVIDFNDIMAVVDKFRNLPTAPSKSRSDLAPDLPDLVVDFVDISHAVDAFRGFAYPFGGPEGCP